MSALWGFCRQGPIRNSFTEPRIHHDELNKTSSASCCEEINFVIYAAIFKLIFGLKKRQTNQKLTQTLLHFRLIFVAKLAFLSFFFKSKINSKIAAFAPHFCPEIVLRNKTKKTIFGQKWGANANLSLWSFCQNIYLSFLPVRPPPKNLFLSWPWQKLFLAETGSYYY